jgi:phospholipase/carboxylesterase
MRYSRRFTNNKACFMSLSCVELQSAPGEPVASVVWLHGLGASGHDFEPIVPELGLSDAAVRFVFPHAPEQAVTINQGMRMPAWYDIKGTDLSQREDAEGLARSASLVAELLQAEQDKGIDRLLLAGFSQGGALALYHGLRAPQSLRGILALSCYLPLGDKLGAEASESNRQTPILMQHGTHDPVVPVALGDMSQQALNQAGYAVQWQTYPMAHQVCLEQIHDIGRWLRERLL